MLWTTHLIWCSARE